LICYKGYVELRLADWGEPSKLTDADMRVVSEAFEDAVGSLAATERVINHRKARALGLEIPRHS
jgi:hypothetical protein